FVRPDRRVGFQPVVSQRRSPPDYDRAQRSEAPEVVAAALETLPGKRARRLGLGAHACGFQMFCKLAVRRRRAFGADDEHVGAVDQGLAKLKEEDASQSVSVEGRHTSEGSLCGPA